jgi:DNA-binding Lrp family transcriptional regulator
MEFDDKQREIMRVLQRDAKKSLREISDELDYPLSTVYSRILKMEEEGFINGYKTVFNAEKIGLPTTAFILIRLRFREPGSKESYEFREIADKIAKIPEIQEVHMMSGEWDVIVKYRAVNSKEVGAFIMDRLRKIEGVERCLTCMVFDTVKDTTDLPI